MMATRKVSEAMSSIVIEATGNFEISPIELGNETVGETEVS